MGAVVAASVLAVCCLLLFAAAAAASVAAAAAGFWCLLVLLVPQLVVVSWLSVGWGGVLCWCCRSGGSSVRGDSHGMFEMPLYGIRVACRALLVTV